MEALDISVLPRASRIDIQRLNLTFLQPFLDLLRDEFAAIIAADVLRDALGHHRLPKGSQDLPRSDLALDTDSQTLTGILVEHR